MSVLAVTASAITLAITDGKAPTPSWPAALKSRSVVEMHDGELVSYSLGHPSGVAYVIPSYDDLDVWLVRHRPGAGSTVSRVSVNGDRQENFPLPGDYTVIADVSAGLLVQDGPRLMVWAPATNEVVYRFPASYRSQVATGGPDGRDVAWRDDHCSVDDQCQLHLTDVATQVDQTLVPPAGDRGFLSGGAFEPDKAPFTPDTTTIAAFVADPHHPGRIQIDLVTTVPTLRYRLSGDIPRHPAVTPTAGSYGHEAVLLAPTKGAKRLVEVVDP